MYRPGMEFAPCPELARVEALVDVEDASVEVWYGQGYPHPDFDRYSSVGSGVAPPTTK